MISIEHLRSIKLLEGSSSEQFNELAELFTYNHLAHDEYLIQHTEEGEFVYFLLDGKLLASINSPDGKQVIYRHFKIGETVGDYSAIDGMPRSATVSSDGDSTIATLSRANFMHILKTNPIAAFNECNHLVAHLRVQAERIYELSTQATMERLKAELIRMSEKNPSQEKMFITCMPRQSVIAARIGTNREAVSRHLVKLEKDGLISRSGESLIIESPQSLISNAPTLGHAYASPSHRTSGTH